MNKNQQCLPHAKECLNQMKKKKKLGSLF